MMSRSFIIIVLMLIISSGINAQEMAVGVRLGDPSGISLKKYFDGKAYELSIGRSRIFLNDEYYHSNFNQWYIESEFAYAEFDYIRTQIYTPVSVQAHYLIQKKLSKVGQENTPGLEWYYGLGAQLGFQTYSYDYRYRVPGNSTWFNSTSEKVTDIDIGADAVIGLEYKFKNSPVSLFTDITLFMEILDNPFDFWFQGGIGARYRL